MKRFLLVVLIALAAMPAMAAGRPDSSVLRGSGRLVSVDLDYTDFNSVAAGFGAEVKIHQGDAYNVRLRADDNLIDEVKTEKRGRELRFFLASDVSIANGTFQIEIVMPRLLGLDLSGGAQGNIEMDMPDEAFNAVFSGGTTVVGRVTASSMNLECSGGSTCTLRGSARELDLNASGGAKLLLFGVSAVDANINVSGGSHMEVNASTSIRGEATGGASLLYEGSPQTVIVDASGGGSVRRR